MSYARPSFGQLPAAPHIRYDSFLGATFVGLLVATILFGVACIQTFFYFQDSKVDRKSLKITVTVVTVVNTLQLAFLGSLVYGWAVSEWGNMQAIRKSTISAVVQVPLACFSDLIVRSFFARRVFILCGPKNKRLAGILASIIVGVAITVAVLTTEHSVRIYFLNQLPPTPERTGTNLKLSWMLYAFYGLGATDDLMIALALSWLLLRNRTGFKRTDDIVMFWVSFSMKSGLITSIVGLIALVVYATHPTSLYSLGISYVLNQLHVNSFLMSLNVRGTFRNRDLHQSSTSEAYVTDNRLTMSAEDTGGVDGTCNDHSVVAPLRGSQQSITKDVSPSVGRLNVQQFGF